MNDEIQTQPAETKELPGTEVALNDITSAISLLSKSIERIKEKLDPVLDHGKIKPVGKPETVDIAATSALADAIKMKANFIRELTDELRNITIQIDL